MKAVVLVLAALAPFGASSGFSDRESSPGAAGVFVRGRRDAAPSPSSSKQLNPLWKPTWTDKLKQDLLLNYDKFARPQQHGNQTSVAVYPSFKHLELDEKRGIMTIHCWVRMEWIDDKLKWDPKNYNGLKELHLADHEVWQPDIYPYNSASGSSIDHYGNTNLIAYGNGSVLWVPPSIFHVFCPMDFSKWPVDTQVCQLKLGSWTYNGEQVDLVSEDHGQTMYELPDLFPNAEWNFVMMKVKRTVSHASSDLSFVDLTWQITIQRNSATYKTIIVTPAVVVVLLTLAMFWLPPMAADKITLGGTAVILVCLFVLYFSQNIPSMGSATPHLVMFYIRCLYLTSIAIGIAVGVINLARNPKTSSLPWIVKKNLTGWLGKCLLIRDYEARDDSKAEELTDSQPVFSEQGRHLSENLKLRQKDWILLATAIDRIFFLIYCFVYVVLILSF